MISQLDKTCNTKVHQRDKVLEHLMKYGSITQREATDCYAITRLGARIYDLKQFGFPIEKVMEKSKNRFGEPTWYARYFLRKEP